MCIGDNYLDSHRNQNLGCPGHGAQSAPYGLAAFWDGVTHNTLVVQTMTKAKICLATFLKGWSPAGPPEAI
ncbi:hypothetical protein DBB_12960 [Desulfoluna spongiiphila]|nr:hypothetical protein DBB_12960 [Desulfoluna spongiiphila]